MAEHPGNIIEHLGTTAEHPDTTIEYTGTMSECRRSMIEYPSTTAEHPGNMIEYTGTMSECRRSMIEYPSTTAEHPGNMIEYPGTMASDTLDLSPVGDESFPDPNGLFVDENVPSLDLSVYGNLNELVRPRDGGNCMAISRYATCP